MGKVAIIGANGQVGAELCLLLADRPDFQLIPICRTRSGSAFLRWQGIACRHGRVADARDAQRLLADCDVVINCSLATGTPAEIRNTEDRIVHSACAHSMPGASIIHFSTQSVYGDPRGSRAIRWRNPYGRAKLATERSIRRAARQFAKKAYILRLGHVCGSLQEISNTIRSQIQAGDVVLPRADRSSNTVYTAAVAGAVLQIIEGQAEPGTYDLMNTPRWTWSAVYEYERSQCGVDDYSPEFADSEGAPGGAKFLRRTIAGLAGSLASIEWIRDVLAKVFAHLPDGLNAHAQAWWYLRRARMEMGALHTRRPMAEHLTWIENGTRFFPAARQTKELLATTFIGPILRERASWPEDLPDAPGSSAQQV